MIDSNKKENRPSNWHFMLNGESCGPVSEDKLIDKIERGEILNSTLLWAKGQDEWLPAKELFDFESLTPPPLPKSNKSRASKFKRALLDNSWALEPVHPWRRYFAKLIDLFINGGAAYICLTFFLQPIAPKLTNDLIELVSSSEHIAVVVCAVLSVFGSALLISFTGTTIGKFFFGLKVISKDGSKLNIMPALEREFKVIGQGLAFGLPIFTLFTMWFSYKNLLKNGNTDWDIHNNCAVYARNSRSALQLFLFLVGAAIVFSIFALNALLDN